MSTTIESLELEIKSNSNNAGNGIDALTQSLTKLKSATKGGLGLNAVASQIQEIGTASAAINPTVSTNVSGLAKAISSFNGIKISSSIATQITAISNSLSGVNFENGKNQIQAIVPALRSLSSLPKLNLTTYINNMSKLEKALGKLNNVDIASLSAKIKELAVAFKPLADEMQKVANGFSSFPDKIQKLIKSTNEIPKANNRASFSFTDLYHKINTVIRGFKTLYSTIEKSNDYIENVNLFEVAMGEYASDGMIYPEKVKKALGEASQGAMDYAELVSEAMGVDTSEWIRSQGIFMTMATGFGIAGDRAAQMSSNLTQLGYDLSSFYNMDIEDAMAKLKSGLAGELEPLRAIGYDLSQAKLEAIALQLGIDKSVTSMTQAEKAQLRYYAIMTQVTDAHGDLARTLDDPANQVRMFKAQLSMAARDIGNIFIPMLKAILPVAISVTKVIRSIAQSIASLVGYIPEEVGEGTVAMVENTDAVTEGLEDAQEEAKKLKSYMLGFDELNVINPNTSNGVDDSSSEFGFDLPDYTETFWGNLSTNPINELVEKMKEWLGITEDIDSWAELLETRFGNILVTVGYIGGAIALWSISNSVLSFINNFSKFATALKYIGAVAIIGAAIAGATWLVNNTEDTVGKIGALLSGAALATGAILAFTGINLPLGIALMAVGALSMGSAIALKTDALSDEVKGVIAVITSAVSVALLVVGAALAFTGANIPLGIALLAGGALTMATAIAPNWNSLSDSIQETITHIFNVVSPALLVLGAILAFTGANVPLGIGLMLAGAVGLGTSAALNWNILPDAISENVDKIVVVVSSALLALGAILAVSGANIPLGIGLMIGGAGGLAAAVTIDWTSIKKKIKGVLEDITSSVSDWWNGLFGKDGELELGVNAKVNAGVSAQVSVAKYATGGFPEQGQMFIAREAGAEMVGNIGRRTAVANNDQIVSSISGGVAEANEEQNALLREQNSLLRAILEKDSGVYLDGKNLTNSVEKYQRERGRVLISGGVV